MKNWGVELLREYISDQFEKRKLRRDKEWKNGDGAWKRMATAGNVAIATSAGEERRTKKKKREHQHLETARVAGSSAVNQLKQANKEGSVEAKEEKTAPVDTTEHVEEAEDKKSAAVQRVEDVRKKKTKSQQQKIGQRQIYRDKEYLHWKLFYLQKKQAKITRCWMKISLSNGEELVPSKFRRSLIVSVDRRTCDVRTGRCTFIQ